MSIRIEHTEEEGITVITEDDTRLSVDVDDDDEEPCRVWIKICIGMAACCAVLTKEEAKAFAASITQFAEAP